MLEKREFYINGAWVKSQGGREHPVIDPSTEEPCAVITLGSEADANAAVAAAKAAFPAWMNTPAAERIALVEKLIELYEARGEDMAQAISLEMGAPIDMARSQQVGAGTWHLKNFVGEEVRFHPPAGRSRAGRPDHLRARRCRRTDHAVELADEPGDAEGRRRGGGRLHHGHEAQ